MSGVGSGPILQLRQIEKRFGDFAAVTDVDLDIAEGEFFTLVGPSGSGKTEGESILFQFEISDLFPGFIPIDKKQLPFRRLGETVRLCRHRYQSPGRTPLPVHGA